VTFARLATDRETQRSRGFGFVSYTSKAAADRAIEKLNGTELEGRNIEVKEADNKGDRPPRADRSGGYGGDRGGGDRAKSSGECFAFKKGNCTRGDSCRFSHENGGGSRPRQNDQYDEAAPRKQYREEGGRSDRY
jgi:RNA recognition motif-containing protein